jgi:23S rRNA (cytidine1920-2'-O)/16S rRNA (cytidine1409-2'-O)-methyltransferase
VDVGYGQLNHHLQRDKRVVVMDRVNARYPFSLPEKVDLVTIDVSFISIEKIIPSVANLLKDSGYLLVLLKPQFEAKKREVGKGGIIREPQVQARVLGRFITWLTSHGFRLGGLVVSPILGASGNKEFFILLRRK